jgi:DNA polymerase-3 subunit gamma/tau
MLSSGAFNALLKTLEEPPKNVIFILATTEPHKIPATILSRCQKFDFKRIDSETTLKLCLKICDSMEVSYEESAINLIVKNSDGSARDALSLLDRVINGTGRHITYEDTLKLLGIVVDEFLVKITDFLIEKDSKSIFVSIEEFFQSGKNLNYFIKRLVYHFRNLLMGKSGVELENILNESLSYTENVRRQSQKFSTNEIIRIIDITSKLEGELKYSSQGRIAFEVAMAKIMNPVFDDSEGGLLSRIEKLEKKIKEGNFISSNSYKESSKVKVNEKEKCKEEEGSESKNNGVENHEFKKVVKASKSEDFINIKNSWENVLTSIKEKSVKVHAFAIEGTPVSLEDGKFILGFEDCFGFHVEMLLRPENKRVVEEVISQKIGKTLILECEFLSNIKEENSKEEEYEVDDVSKITEFFSEMSDTIEIIE